MFAFSVRAYGLIPMPFQMIEYSRACESIYKHFAAALGATEFDLIHLLPFKLGAGQGQGS
jgi:hypothetical protein